MKKALLIYDDECPFCRAARDWVMVRAKSGTIIPLPCQSDERQNLLPGIREADCLDAMHLVLPDGSIYAGDAAVEMLLPLLRPGWSWLRLFFRFPGIRLITPVLYRYIARHRYALAGLVRNADQGKSCGKDRNCPL